MAEADRGRFQRGQPPERGHGLLPVDVEDAQHHLPHPGHAVTGEQHAVPGEMHTDGAGGVPGGVDHPRPAPERQHRPVGQLGVDPGRGSRGNGQRVFVQRAFPVQEHRLPDLLLAPDHRRVQPVRQNLGAVPAGQLLGGAVVVPVAVGDDDPRDVGGVVAEAAHRLLDGGRRVHVARVDQGQLRPVAPEVRLADRETEHVQLRKHLYEIHAANLSGRDRPPHGSTLSASFAQRVARAPARTQSAFDAA